MKKFSIQLGTYEYTKTFTKFTVLCNVILVTRRNKFYLLENSVHYFLANYIALQYTKVL